MTAMPLLRRRDRRPADRSDGADLRDTAAAEWTDPDAAVDGWPLRTGDPAWVDDYRLVYRLGVGGMADVFYAEAPTGGPVAVKLLRARGAASRTCQREYRLASAVHVDCTAPPLGYGLSAAGAYLVTAYLPGYRSATTLEGGPTPTAQLWAFGSALARALAGVHARGVVHCDVKPANLLIRGEDVRVIDFGIARYVGQPCGGDGMVACSRGWAAPEQLRAEPATPAVDVFAWGCVLAYLAGGVHPFAGRTERDWVLRVQAAEPDLLGISSGLAGVIRQSLARDPAQRPSARQLAVMCGTRDATSRQATRPVPRADPATVNRRRPPTRLGIGLRRWLRTLQHTAQDLPLARTGRCGAPFNLE